MDLMDIRRVLMGQMASNKIDVLHHYTFTEHSYGHRVDLPDAAFTKYKRIWVIVYCEKWEAEVSTNQWIYPFLLNSDDTTSATWLQLAKDKLPYCVFAELEKDEGDDWKVLLTSFTGIGKSQVFTPLSTGNYFTVRMYNSATDYFEIGSEIIVIGEKAD